MQRINRDVVIAIVLLAACGVLFWATFDIRQPDYGVLPPSTWPRLVVGVLTALSAIYLVQSLRRGLKVEMDEKEIASRPENFRAFLAHWRNPFWCFILFFAYLLLMPVLGMLIDGIVFVFVLLGMLGGWNLRDMPLHAAVAVFAVGGMWSVFTFGLNVLLPTGMLFDNI